MATGQKQPFSNTTMGDNHKAIVAASAAVQNYVTVLAQQPDFDLSVLSKLSGHMKTAREHGSAWSSKVLPNIIKLTEDVIDYANNFQSFYSSLVQYAKDISNPQSRKNLVDGLKQLQTNMEAKLDTVRGVQKQLNDFNETFSADYRAFQSDKDKAEVKIVGDQGGLKDLQKELDDIHKAMKTDIALMAVGAVSIVGGGALIIVGIFAEIPTLGISTALVAGGLVGVAGGALLETEGAQDYTKQIQLLKKATATKEKEEAELVGLKHADSHITGLTTAISSVISSVSTFSQGWLSLGASLNEVVMAIEDVDPALNGDIIAADLSTANKDWNDVLELAKNLEPNGQVSAKVVKDLEATLKSLQKA